MDQGREEKIQSAGSRRRLTEKRIQKSAQRWKNWRVFSGVNARNLILLIEKSRKLQISLPVRMIEQYLKNNFRENISLEEVAASVHLTPVYLSGLFKKETGKTFSDYLFEIRMEEAKRLLREDTVKIKDVAERSGYADSRYFSKVFSKAFGITPKEYRRLHCWRT